jgi:WD40 repeat protein
MSKIDAFLKSITQDSSETINWSANLGDFVLKIIPVNAQNALLVVGSSGKILLLHKWSGKTLLSANLPVSMVFFAEIDAAQKTVIIGTDKGIFALNSENLEQEHFHQENQWFEKGKWLADHFLASFGKTFMVFKSENGSFELVKKDNSFTSTISAIECNGTSALVSNYGGITQYDLGDGFDTFKSFPWNTSLLELAWSPDRKYISSGTQERSVHFWPYPFEPDADFEISGFEAKVSQICWSDDSKFLALNADEDVHVWSFEDGPPVGKSPVELKGALGKIVKIHFKNSLLIACSKEGFIFSYLPDVSSRFINIKTVDGEITELFVDEEEENIVVGTADGLITSMEINI